MNIFPAPDSSKYVTIQDKVSKFVLSWVHVIHRGFCYCITAVLTGNGGQSISSVNICVIFLAHSGRIGRIDYG